MQHDRCLIFTLMLLHIFWLISVSVNDKVNKIANVENCRTSNVCFFQNALLIIQTFTLSNIFTLIKVTSV
jgi:hypothetical protein